MGGDAADEVMGVNDLDDYRRFRDTLTQTGAKKVAVIGAGLIGCEFTNDFSMVTSRLKPSIQWITAYPRYCLKPQDALFSERRRKRRTLHFGPLATDVNRSEGGYTVALNNGETIEADAVLSAVGVRLRTQLAADGY